MLAALHWGSADTAIGRNQGEELAKPLRLKWGNITQQQRKSLLVGVAKLFKQSISERGQARKHHSSVIRMSFAMCPALPGQDVDIQRCGATSNRESAREFRWCDPRVPDHSKFDKSAKCPRCQVKIGQCIGGRAIECTCGSQQLHERTEAQTVFCLSCRYMIRRF